MKVTNGAVAFIDILGFKGIWQSMPPEKIIDIFEGIKPRINNKYLENTQAQKPPFTSAAPQVTILSDTVVITIESDNPLCLAIIATVIFDLYDYFAKHHLFFRGAIGYGQYIQFGSTFIGPTIDDVASWYESANLIGVITTPKTSYRIDRFSALVARINTGERVHTIPCYIKYNIPARQNDTKYFLNCVNWPSYRDAMYVDVPPGVCATRKQLEELYSEQTPFDNSVLIKYENTLKFVDYCFAHSTSNSCTE